MKTPSMKKSIYSVSPLEKIYQPVRDSKRTYRGFNLFYGDDLNLLLSLVRGEFNISGFQNSNLCMYLSEKTPHHFSRLIKRLRKHGLIRKIRNTYKYSLTALGRGVILTALMLREMFIIPYIRGILATLL